MKHYLDIRGLKGNEIEPVDVITFGSPCQDVSVAGRQVGIKHSEVGDTQTTRSGLVFEALRIVREMREATNNEQPRYILWENVTGVFGTNDGEDFRLLLESVCRVADAGAAVPKSTRWQPSGAIMGNGYTVAWRTLDAKHWGVPQHRERVFLVADCRGDSASEVLYRTDTDRLIYSACGAQEIADTGESDEDATAATCTAVTPIYAIAGNSIGRLATNGGNGVGVNAETMNTLTETDRHGLLYETSTGVVVFRHCTPKECARFQGFPDWWGELAEYKPEDEPFWREVFKLNNKTNVSADTVAARYAELQSDRAEYAMWGNGVALPCVEYIVSGLEQMGVTTLGSLFDGSGGFPLAAVMHNITPVWASEIEPYPIAVTKSHFDAGEDALRARLRLKRFEGRDVFAAVTPLEDML